MYEWVWCVLDWTQLTNVLFVNNFVIIIKIIFEITLEFFRVAVIVQATYQIAWYEMYRAKQHYRQTSKSSFFAIFFFVVNILLSNVVLTTIWLKSFDRKLRQFTWNVDRFLSRQFSTSMGFIIRFFKNSL